MMGFLVAPVGIRRAPTRKSGCRFPNAEVRLRSEIHMFKFGEASEGVEVPSSGVSLEAAQVSRLKRFLRGRKFLRLVAENARCPFVRFTGVIYKRCEVTEEYNQGIPPQYQKYETNVNFHVVDIPPPFLEKSDIQPQERRLCAVFERFGVPVEELYIEQEILNASILEEEHNYERWADASDFERTEGPVTPEDQFYLFER
mmetsp:Transcript_17991/g.72027  ORF Transcript_17991/g.72027 Transcript_17991/m.72027 type:complete len:200 (+) Transcript_17991:419-1018(+)